MDISLIFKIAAVGLIVAVLTQVLNKAGREEQSMLVGLAGLVIVLLVLVNEFGKLFSTLKLVFGF
ncbi:MAG: stage III sporulation protein AC [Clostridia bacterium]|nr:stage III sporulation protein AC [Clostridia bacterium]